MPLPNYGLLSGRVVDHGPQPGDNPHYLLFIQAGVVRFRVAVNLQSTLTLAASPPQLEYQVIDKVAASPGLTEIIDELTNQGSFELSSRGAASLDFVRGNLLDMAAFTSAPAGAGPEANAYAQELIAAAEKAKEDPAAFVAVFGTGYSDNAGSSGPHADPRVSSQGFTGVDNIHMNQGSFYQVGTHLDSHYAENGPNQDGGLLFFFGDKSVRCFFSKFHSQDTQTDSAGNPVHTGVALLDSIAPDVRARVVGSDPFAGSVALTGASKPTVSADAATGGGYVFSDPSSTDDQGQQYVADNDSAVQGSAYVAQFATGAPEPVPGPRNGAYPTMNLSDVIGPTATAAITAAGQIVFHAVGDTGAAQAGTVADENKVGALMIQDFSAGAPARPAFFFHLGDVVYFFGEQAYYYSQFYRPYKEYPAPIFAVPGNHDGITYDASMVSLAGFIQAFADSAPNHWVAAGGVARTTMTQPGVYFTLNAPFVSIIGLYSNCSESYGYLDAQQKLFLYNELVRLKPLRESGDVSAVILAVHHSPLSYSAAKPSSGQMRTDIDNACSQASFYPDAVLSGHAHIYQRITRTVPVGGANWQVPYIISGSGGYGLNANQELEKPEFAQLDSSDAQFKLHKFLPHFGYLRVTVTAKAAGAPATLKTEFQSPNLNNGDTADTCLLNLDTHALM